MADAQVASKKLLKGTPEGDKLVRVRWMRPGDYGPSPALIRRYAEGEECVIPMWRFTDFHNPETIITSNGGSMTFRGSHEMADRPKPVDANVPQHSEVMQDVLKENEDLRSRIAKLEAAAGKPVEPLVVVDEKSGKRSKKEEI